MPRLFWLGHRRILFPEADVLYPTAPSGPIRFGSFNHNRKLTDATLRLWAELLAAVPGSRLVLKASSQTATLILSAYCVAAWCAKGLDPERVDWLALTKGPVEHMQQYAQIDIALDPIPNGGCTTTCEALWMGVPTITMAGSHYVSRMSTAVLAGANMTEWIAKIEFSTSTWLVNMHPAFLSCASSVSIGVVNFSSAHWVMPQILMHHLEAAFSQMHAEVLSRV